MEGGNTALGCGATVQMHVSWKDKEGYILLGAG